MVSDRNAFLDKIVGEALQEGEIWTETGIEWGGSTTEIYLRVTDKCSVKDKDPEQGLTWQV